MNLDKFERFVSNTFCNVGQSFYDSYVEANVGFRSKLGMKTVIIRRQLGNCCGWCASLAGIYDVYNAPDDIYKRHRNCRCLVTYKTEEGYQNVWNKKIYKTQRDSRIEKLKSFSSDRDKFEIFEVEKRKLLSENKHIYDATNEWNAKANPKSVIIKSIRELRIAGKRYSVDGKHVILDLKKQETYVLEKFVKKFGGIMQYHPRIVFPMEISTPDCLYNGIRYDLKQIGLNNPGTRNKDALLNMIDGKERQAHCFIFDVSRSGLTREEAIKQAYQLFFRNKTKYIQKAILFDGEFYKVIERI